MISCGEALDAHDRPHYIARFLMDVLLFLSAILTALTGAITGARVAEPQHVAASSIAAVAAEQMAQRIGVMPLASAIPANESVATVQRLDLTAPTPRAVTLFSDRRRE